LRIARQNEARRNLTAAIIAIKAVLDRGGEKSAVLHYSIFSPEILSRALSGNLWAKSFVYLNIAG